MGAGCCGEERNIMGHRKNPKVPLAKEEEEKTFSSEKFVGIEDSRYNNESDADNLTDLYITNRESIQSEATEVLSKALRKAGSRVSENSIPFLITPISLNSPTITVFSKNLDTLAYTHKEPITAQGLVKGHCTKPFFYPSRDKDKFMRSLKEFLVYFFMMIY